MITFVTAYATWYDVSYKSANGKISRRTYKIDKLPASVKAFMESASTVHRYTSTTTYSNNKLKLKGIRY